MLDSKFFRKINAEVIMRYRKHIFDPAGGGSGAKDVFDKKYPAYTSTQYRIAKSKGIIKAGGKGGKPQDLKFKASNAPVLTGDLYKTFDTHHGSISNGFGFGTLTEQSKVRSLAKLKRYISTNAMPLPNKVAKYIMDQADKYVKAELGKIKGRTFNI